MKILMKIFLALIVLLMLSISSSAKPNVATTGPYSISFDLNASTEPTVSAGSESGNDSVWYYVNVGLNNKTVATIGIISYNDWQDATFSCSRLKMLLLHAVNESGEIRDAMLIKRTIDGNVAEVETYVSTMSNSNVTDIVYWKDSKNSGYGQVLVGKTKVELLSTLPTDLIENLLNTLKVTATEKPSTTSTINSNSLHMTKTTTKPVVDANCVHEWTDLGYTPSQIAWMGWCVPS